MKNQTRLGDVSTFLGGCLAALVLSSGAYAQGHGGGGHAGGGGGHAGGGSAGGYHGGGYGYHGGGYGYHGGYGYRGGYGWHGGYGWRGYGWGCCGWGWGWAGLGLGLYFASLPLYYTTYWWNGVPYYYADNTYYSWDPGAGQYVTVAPPAGLQGSAPGGSAAPGGAEPPAGTDLMVYPKNGQSAEQQGKDKFECHQWAASQSGFDPTLGAAPAGSANKRYDYMRAQAACLEGRGYSVQ